MVEKINAFQFLSNYHHQLHVMIGEEEGDINNAFDLIVNVNTCHVLECEIKEN